MAVPDFEKLQKINIIGEIYTPAYPVEIQDLFAGRREQLTKAFSIIPQKGLHAIIYGDRGVGKTSFSNIIKVLFENTQPIHKISCTSEDTFNSLWRNIFSGFSVKREIVYEKASFRKDTEKIENIANLSELIPDGEIATTDVLRNLKLLGNSIVIIDEFDRLNDDCFNKKIFTDTIKAISDSLPNTTIIIVGVSEDISNLIIEHESIERNISQIYIPTMSGDEIKQIITSGEEPLGLQFDQRVINKIIQLASGYPHFAHSLCYYSANNAIMLDSDIVNDSHLQIAIKQTIDNTHESLRNSYRIATAATKENYYTHVLFAASIVEPDEYGYFQANDLEPILSKLLDRTIKVNNFVPHLAKFCTVEKGQILKMSGVKYAVRYKFKNPLMKAFIKLKIENEKNRPKPPQLAVSNLFL